MSCICFTDGDCDENRIFLAPVTVVATAANIATAGGSLELPECSDLVLGGYLALGKTCSHQVLAASRISPSWQVLVHHLH